MNSINPIQYDPTDSPLVQTMRQLVKEAQPKFDTIINVAFTYTDGGRWHTVDLNFNEYLAVLQSGELDGKQITAIEVSTTNADNEDGDKIRIIYDFMLMNTGKNPWRML